jgi:hypothetical protein
MHKSQLQQLEVISGLSEDAKEQLIEGLKAERKPMQCLIFKTPLKRLN